MYLITSSIKLSVLILTFQLLLFLWRLIADQLYKQKNKKTGELQKTKKQNNNNKKKKHKNKKQKTKNKKQKTKNKKQKIK